MGHRAECVMLNKGPYIDEALCVLDDILKRMDRISRRSVPCCAPSTSPPDSMASNVGAIVRWGARSGARRIYSLSADSRHRNGGHQRTALGTSQGRSPGPWVMAQIPKTGKGASFGGITTVHLVQYPSWGNAGSRRRNVPSLGARGTRSLSGAGRSHRRSAGRLAAQCRGLVGARRRRLLGRIFPGVKDGDLYRFYVVGQRGPGFKRDPYARELEMDGYPECNCIVRDPGTFVWHDRAFALRRITTSSSISSISGSSTRRTPRTTTFAAPACANSWMWSIASNTSRTSA